MLSKAGSVHHEQEMKLERNECEQGFLLLDGWLQLVSLTAKWWKILPQAKARSGSFCVWTEFLKMQSKVSF